MSTSCPGDPGTLETMTTSTESSSLTTNKPQVGGLNNRCWRKPHFSEMHWKLLLSLGNNQNDANVELYNIVLYFWDFVIFSKYHILCGHVVMSTNIVSPCSVNVDSWLHQTIFSLYYLMFCAPFADIQFRYQTAAALEHRVAEMSSKYNDCQSLADIDWYPVWSTLIGRGISWLVSHWSRAFPRKGPIIGVLMP